MAPFALPGDIMSDGLDRLVQLALVYPVLEGKGMNLSGPLLILLFMAFTAYLRRGEPGMGFVPFDQ
jgi:hypothetical protein